MKRLFFIVLTIAALGVGMFAWGIASDRAVVAPTPLDSRIPAYELIEYRGHQYHVVRVDLKKQDLRMFYQNSEGNRYGSIDTLKRELEDQHQKLIFATNGGIYAEDFSPLGLYIEHGEELAKLNTSKASTGNFFLQPNGVFEIFSDTYALYTTAEWSARNNPRPDYAVQSGPMLVVDGLINSNFTENSSRALIRSGVGSGASAEELVFVLSDDPVNFYDFAAFFRDSLGSQRALYLDGAISDMYVQGVYLANFRNEYSTIFGITIPN